MVKKIPNMNLTAPSFSIKTALLLPICAAFLVLLGSCNPFDDEFNCPKLVGKAKTGKYTIEKVLMNNDRLSSFQFLGSLNGYAFQDFRQLVKTTDGGENWMPTNVPMANFPLFHFSSRDTGFVALSSFDQTSFREAFVFLRTNDGGQTTKMIGDTLLGRPSAIHFFDGTDGCFVGYFQYIDPITGGSYFIYGLFSTQNGGETWAHHPDVQPGFSQKPMSWVSRSVGFCQSQFGWVYRTTDGGQNWVAMNGSTFLGFLPDCHFLDENFGYSMLANSFDFSAPGTVFITENGGRTWQSWPFPNGVVAILDTDNNKNGLFVAKSTKCGNDGAFGFFTSSDGGATTDETNPLDNVFQWEPCHFGDPKQFFVVVNGNQLLKVVRQ